VHTAVRELERDAGRLAAEIAVLETRISRLRGDDADIVDDRDRLSRRLDALKAEREALIARIPADWDAVHDEFAKLTKAETNTGNAYRRAADQSYGPPSDMAAKLRGASALRVLRGAIENLPRVVADQEPDDAAAAIATIELQLRDVADASDISNPLGEARRALEGGGDRDKALAAITKAQAALEAEVAWRQPAAEALLPGLQAYVDAIRTNLGLRQLQRLPREQAIWIAGCNASHRDVSLNF
jgi:hypothetical protein